MDEQSRQHALPKAAALIITEDEGTRGWDYQVRITWPSDAQTEHRVHLSWMDHDALCGGAVAPSSLVEKAVRLAADHFGETDLPSRFDISTLHRVIPGFGAAFSYAVD